MKFEEALPFMRQGRRARPANSDHILWRSIEDLAHWPTMKCLTHDWELEPEEFIPEPTVTITRKQLADAWDKQGCAATLERGHVVYDCEHPTFELLAAALGLPEQE